MVLGSIAETIVIFIFPLNILNAIYLFDYIFEKWKSLRTLHWTPTFVPVIDMSRCHDVTMSLGSQFHVDSFQLKAVGGDRVTNQNKQWERERG